MTRKTKLTLSIDEDLIRHAKRFTQRHGTSISKLVSQFLASLGDEGRHEQGSVVSRLRGVLPHDASVEDYRRHLDEKYGR